MRDRDDRDAGLAALRAQQLSRIERHALEPRVEAGRGEEVVHLHGELRALFRWIEGLEIERADGRHWRLLYLGDERAEVEPLALAPGFREEVRDQDVLAALDRIRGDAKKAEDAARRRGHAITQELAVIAHRLRGRRERGEYRDGDARAR